MKNNRNKISALCCLIFASVFLFSCEEDDSEKQWGEALIYMPQVNINGNLTNILYPVPLKNNASTKNYEVRANKQLYVYLGVYRSGLQKLESFTVDVAADLQSTNEYVVGNANRRALSTDAFTLPNKVTVPDGERETTFYLVVDLNKLGTASTNFNIVLDVFISNPSKYELKKELTKTRVVIDGREFLPN